MTNRMPTTALLMALLTALLLPLAACGGDDGDGSAAPSAPVPPVTASAPAPLPSAAPTATAPSPTPVPPLSRFEGDPAVQGLRAYAVAFASAVNTRMPRAPRLLALATAAQQRDIPRAYRDDVGSWYPGPVPFTPLRVTALSATAKRLTTCLVDDGFTLTRRGGEVKDPERVAYPTDVVMRLQGERWKVDGFATAEHSCRGVRVTDVRTDGSAQPGAGS